MEDSENELKNEYSHKLENDKLPVCLNVRLGLWWGKQQSQKEYANRLKLFIWEKPKTVFHLNIYCLTICSATHSTI